MGAGPQRGQSIVEALIIFTILFLLLAVKVPEVLQLYRAAVQTVSLTRELK